MRGIVTGAVRDIIISDNIRVVEFKQEHLDCETVKMLFEFNVLSKYRDSLDSATLRTLLVDGKTAAIGGVFPAVDGSYACTLAARPVKLTVKQLRKIMGAVKFLFNCYPDVTLFAGVDLRGKNYLRNVKFLQYLGFVPFETRCNYPEKGSYTLCYAWRRNWN
jgi:hypothetical protein